MNQGKLHRNSQGCEETNLPEKQDPEVWMIYEVRMKTTCAVLIAFCSIGVMVSFVALWRQKRYSALARGWSTRIPFIVQRIGNCRLNRSDRGHVYHSRWCGERSPTCRLPTSAHRQFLGPPVPHAAETFASIPRACLRSLWSFCLLQPLAAHISLDQDEALVEDVPICITASLQSWRQRKLDPSSFHTLAVSIATSTASTLITVVHVFHLAVIETIAPELIWLAASEGDEAVVGALPFHLEIEGNRCGDNGIELLFTVAQ